MKRSLLLLATEGDTLWAALYRVGGRASPKLLKCSSGSRVAPLWVKWHSLLHPAILLPQNVPFVIRSSTSQSPDGLLNNLGISLVERKLHLGPDTYTLCARDAAIAASLQQVAHKGIRVSGIQSIPAVLLAWIQRSPDLAGGFLVHQLGDTLLLLQMESDGPTARYKPAGANFSLDPLVDGEGVHQPLVLLGAGDILARQVTAEPALSIPHLDGHPPPVLNIAATLGDALFELPDFLGDSAAKSAATWRRLFRTTVATAAVALAAISCIFFFEGRSNDLRRTEAELKAARDAAALEQEQLRDLQSKLSDAQTRKEAAQRWRRSPHTLVDFLIRLDEAVEASPSITIEMVQADSRNPGGYRLTGRVSDASATTEVQQLANALGEAEIELRPAGSAVSFVITSRTISTSGER